MCVCPSDYPRASPAAAVEGVRPDAAHNARRDSDTGGSRVTSFSIRLQDVGMHHCVGGNDHACYSEPFHRQARMGAPFPGSSWHIYTISAQSVFPRADIDSRHGDAGALCGFADDPQKVHQAGGLESPPRKIVITRH